MKNELEIIIENPNKNIVLVDKVMESKYVTKSGIFLGKLCIVTYGWNYIGTKDNKKKYIVNSEYIQIKEDRKHYLTEEEAQTFAHEVAKYILKNYLNLV